MPLPHPLYYLSTHNLAQLTPPVHQLITCMLVRHKSYQFGMLQETNHFMLVEVDDSNLQHLFQGFIATPTLTQVQPTAEHNQLQSHTNQLSKETLDKKRKDSDVWSQLNFKDEVYSDRPLSKRRRIRKVENKALKNLKKTRNDTYIRMLENKVQSLEKEISKQKTINKSNQDYIKKLSLSEQIINGVFVGRTQIYDRLETLMEETETEDNRRELIKEITTLRYRLGVQGKDRMKALNHYLKEMVECFIPECQKFLIFSACKGVDFFSKDYIERGVLRYSKEEYWREEIMRALHLSQDQRTTLLTYKPTIIKEKQKYDELVHKFYETKKELTEQAKNLEIVFDNFRGFLSPRQLAKILVNIEKNKYRKEMNLESMDSFWSYDFECCQNVSCGQSLFTTTSEAWC